MKWIFSLYKHNKVREQHSMEITLQALEMKGIHWIQAPYEADAQLAYLANVGVVDYVISTDSDLLVYGTPRVS